MAVSSNAIKEANEQIMLMHSKIQEMEKEIKDLHTKLSSKDAKDSRLQVEQAVKKKDTEMQGLRADLRGTKERINNLEQELIDKDVQIEKLLSKSKILDEIIGFRGSLEGLLSYFKIVQDLDINRNDVNGNLRETQITDGYQSDDGHMSSVVLNGDINATEYVDHV